MSLDVFVCGPGFGETIVLRWQENGKTCGALVDAYAGARGLPLINWLKDLGIESLAFVVVTHPHLDHFWNLHSVIVHFAGKVDVMWWWGGLQSSYYIAYFNHLKTVCPASGNDLGRRARQLELLFKKRRKVFQAYGKPALENVLGVETLYPFGDEPKGISISSFSPWQGSLDKFTRIVRAGTEECRVEDNHQEANLASLGLIIRFGEAQVVLGGDVEEENWKSFRQSGHCSSLTPCLVKVSHHGSQNGTIGGMWTSGGFFSSRKPPIAVITPYRGLLPQKQIVQDIRRAGCRVFVTGQPLPGQDIRPWKSFVHFCVDETGNAKPVNRGPNIAEYDPL